MKNILIEQQCELHFEADTILLKLDFEIFEEIDLLIQQLIEIDFIIVLVKI